MASHTIHDSTKDCGSWYGSTPQSASGDPDLGLLASLKDEDLVEPVVVVGFSFKFPQDADCTDSFWKLLMEQRSTATEFPQDRLSVSANYHPDPNRQRTVGIHKPCVRILCVSPILMNIDTMSWRTFYQGRYRRVCRTILLYLRV